MLRVCPRGALELRVHAQALEPIALAALLIRWRVRSSSSLSAMLPPPQPLMMLAASALCGSIAETDREATVASTAAANVIVAQNHEAPLLDTL
jgi:hypothetical protein